MAPAEFLNSEEKEEFYKSFKLKHPPRPVRMRKIFSWGMTHHAKTVFHPADGFREIYLMSAKSMRAGTTAFDKTLAERLGSDLTKGLDVNAVMIVLRQFTVQDGQTVHDETSIYMFGTSPVTKETAPSVHHQMGHNDKSDPQLSFLNILRTLVWPCGQKLYRSFSMR